jgi:hypothetical protein
MPPYDGLMELHHVHPDKFSAIRAMIATTRSKPDGGEEFRGNERLVRGAKPKTRELQ